MIFKDKLSKYTNYQKIMGIISALLLIGMLIYTVITWVGSPEQLTAHFNSAGEITRWASRNELFFLPVVSLIIYLFLTIVSFYPRIWNVPFDKEVPDGGDIYRCTKDMLLTLKAEELIVFFLATINSTRSGQLPLAVIVISLAAIVITFVVFILRIIYIRGKN